MVKGVEVVGEKGVVKGEMDKIWYSIEEEGDWKRNRRVEMVGKVGVVWVEGEEKIEVNGWRNLKVEVKGKGKRLMRKKGKEVVGSVGGNWVKWIEVISEGGGK